MIRMIPPRLDNAIKSNAERKVFELIKNSTLDGYCFHSVGLADHEYKSYAEADFIVVTEHGILCLEIKGGQVSCDDGVWSFTNRLGETSVRNEGPFQQALGTMYSVKTAFSRHGNISIACGVIFPDIDFKSNNLSVIPEIQMNCNYVGSFKDYLVKCHAYWNSKFRITPRQLDTSAIEVIREKIREDLNYVPLLSLYTESTEKELVRLTNEQVDILESAKSNPRLLISGPAGSGKTLLALEYANIKAKEGEQVLFLTYNKHLATYLKANNSNESIKICNFHGLISEYIPISPDSNPPVYYDKVLPNQFFKYLTNRKIAAYDILIIDEGQDLLKEDYISCLGKLVKGTLGYGKWAIFYDSNQSIFNKNFESNLEAIKKYNPTELRLTKNCRNVIPIARFNNLLSNINTGKAVVEGETVHIESYKSSDEAIEKINSKVEYLISQGIDRKDITIVSPVSFDRSIVNSNDIGFTISHTTIVSGDIRYFTIQSFKGLESKVVLFVDYDEVINSNNSRIIYTSLSRAKALLYLFINEETASKVREMVVQNVAHLA